MSTPLPLSSQVTDGFLAADLRVLEDASDASDVADAHGRWDDVDGLDAVTVAVHARATAVTA